MSSSFGYLFRTLFAPAGAFRRLREDPRPFGRGLRTLLLTSVLWSLTSLALAATGAVPMAPIFVPLRPENYYVWQAIFVLPLFFVVWTVTSALVRLLGRGGKRGGTMKRTLGTLGFAQAVPLLLVWAGQTAVAVFYGLGMGQQELVDILSTPSTVQTAFIAVFGFAAAWSLVLACLAAGVSQKVRWGYALVLGILADALFLAPLVLLLR
jgi:hypothetical protein